MRAVAALLLLGAAALGGDDDPVPALLVRLDSPRPGVRVDATRTLGRIDDARALDAVRKAQDDASQDVRHEAALALAKAGKADETTVAILARSLEGDWYVRWQACVAARWIGPAAKSLLPTLVARLGDEAVEVRYGAAMAIVAVAPEDPRAVLALTVAIGTSKGDTAGLLDALERYGVAAVPTLVGMIADPGFGFRDKAFEVLNRMTFWSLADMDVLDPDHPAFRALLAEIRNPRSEFRERAFVTLRRIAPKGGTVYSELLDSDDATVRAFGARGLGSTRSTKTYALLKRALSDPSAAVRAAGVHAAEEMGKFAWKGLPDLVPLLADSSEETRNAARDAIVAVGARPLADLVGRRYVQGWCFCKRIVVDAPVLVLPVRYSDAAALFRMLTDPDIGADMLRAISGIPMVRDPQRDLDDAILQDGGASRECALVLLPYLARDREQARRTLVEAAKNPDLKNLAERALADLDARK